MDVKPLVKDASTLSTDRPESSKDDSSPDAPPSKSPDGLFSWSSLLKIAGLGTALPALITAGVSVATMLTNCTTEQIKVDANDKDRKLQAAVQTHVRETQLLQDERQRQELNASARRALQTKYVDLALGKELCLDYRVRVFGYLVSVLGASEKAWAEKQLGDAERAQAEIRELKKQRSTAQENLVSTPQNVLDQFKATGAVAEGTTNVLAVFRRTNEQTIKLIDAQLADKRADDPSCYEPREGKEKPDASGNR